MRIRITACTAGHGAWYTDRVGDMVEAFALDSFGYWTRDTGEMRLSQWIKECDAVEIDETIPATDRSEYLKLAAELAGIATRLKELSDAGFADMEGADAQEFKIAEMLHCLDGASETVAKTSMAIREEAEK